MTTNDSLTLACIILHILGYCTAIRSVSCQPEFSVVWPRFNSCKSGPYKISHSVHIHTHTRCHNDEVNVFADNDVAIISYTAAVYWMPTRSRAYGRICFQTCTTSTCCKCSFVCQFELGRLGLQLNTLYVIEDTYCYYQMLQCCHTHDYVVLRVSGHCTTIKFHRLPMRRLGRWRTFKRCELLTVEFWTHEHRTFLYFN